jgi:tetratricopeptide (TPR) repeat protein
MRMRVATAPAQDRSPGNANLLANRGALSERVGELTVAFESYKAALVTNPNHALSLINMGNLYLKQKRYDDAIRNYTQVGVSGPGVALLLHLHISS